MPRVSKADPLRIAVLISGGGTTLKNLLEKQRAGELPIEIATVISSTPSAKGLQFAHDAGLPAHIVTMKLSQTVERFSSEIFAICRHANVELVVLGGFLKLLKIPADFAARVINIHPSLIPAFSGHGYYGQHVHEAVLAYGAKLSGCTVHFVDDQFDHGPIILQRAVEVLDDDTPGTLAARVFAAECEAYPEALRLLAADRVQVDGRRVRVV